MVRAARRDDLQPLYELARQFTLLNLPADRRTIELKIERSVSSFANELTKAEAEYLFVVEDAEAQMVTGCSMIIAKNSTPTSPNHSFKVLKKERYSADLGTGFIHQILRLKTSHDGPTEVGGLVVDRAYRRRPERVGRLISLSRFLYIGMQPDRFETELHAEMAPPLAEDGRSEFWEALGRRFTGMSYAEADQISHQNNLFIQSLFPEEDIYLTLLDSKARLALGRVGADTQGALHLLSKVGFKYKEEVDPFDGGPHLECDVKNCSIVRELKRYRLRRNPKAPAEFKPAKALIGLDRDESYIGTQTPFQIENDELNLPESTWALLDLSDGEEIYFYTESP